MIETSKEIAQRSYLDLFSHLSRIIAQKTDLNDLVLSSVRIIQSVLQVKNCSIMLMDAEEKHLIMRASTIIDEREWSETVVRIGDGIAGRVAETGRAQLVAKSRVKPLKERKREYQKYETDSFICVPLQTAQSILGVINVTDHVDKRLLTAVDLEMLEAIARLIASAISSHYLWVRNQESRDHLAQVIDGLPLGMMTIGASGRLTLCNRAARQYLGVPLAAELNKDWEDYFNNEVVPQIKKARKQLAAGSSSFSAEFTLTSSLEHGKARNVRISAFEAEDIAPLEHNQVLFIIEDLQQMQELWELRRSDQMKSTFLSLISHELRTPLASIKGSVHLLNQMAPPEMQKKADRLFAILHRNSDRLARLVNNILDVMDLESDNLNLYRKRTDLHELVQRIVERFAKAEQEKTIHWERRLDAEESEFYVDEGRFGQVVDHLVENAVKFTTDGGSIRISSLIQDDHWILQVANSGREIEPEQHERVFSRFYQVDETLTRESGGTGIGLYICREIMRLHKGDIRVDPDYSGGARIEVLLPRTVEVV